jgi:hypothetical protein
LSQWKNRQEEKGLSADDADQEAKPQIKENAERSASHRGSAYTASFYHFLICGLSFLSA